MAIKQKIRVYKFFIVLIVFVGCTQMIDSYEKLLENYSFTYSYMSSGNRNIDVDITFSISPEGILSLTFYNNTSYVFGYNEDCDFDLLMKTNGTFNRIPRLGISVCRLILTELFPYYNSTHEVDLFDMFFDERRNIPGIYKFIQEINYVHDNEYREWFQVEDSYVYIIFEIKWN